MRGGKRIVAGRPKNTGKFGCATTPVRVPTHLLPEFEIWLEYNMKANTPPVIDFENVRQEADYKKAQLRVSIKEEVERRQSKRGCACVECGGCND